MDSIMALSVLDGRYKRLTSGLEEIFSEYGLIRHRVLVEVRWLKFLIRELKMAPCETAGLEKIESIAASFGQKDAQKVKEIERTTNHDVKAVEYFIKDRLSELGLATLKEWVHFACTSEDINNTSYALMLKAGREAIAKTVQQVLEKVETLAKDYRSVPMMSRTHGQPASPTTVGKEFVNFAWRLKEESSLFNQIDIQGKMNGATGNFNAHHFVFPDIDWIDTSRKFLSDYLDLKPLLYTTQINPYSYISRLLHNMIRMASIVIDIDRDMWGYISLGYFRQKLKEGEVGSSTMPHKVNPIDFENSEGNMGIAISMMEHLATKLLVSRFQRDLSDSTVLRNLGSIAGYFTIGLKNALKGLGKLDLDEAALQKDLGQNWELLAEPVQTAMRVFGEEKPYEKLKELTRGKKISPEDLARFVDGLSQIEEKEKSRIKALTPETYTGLAEKLVDRYFQAI